MFMFACHDSYRAAWIIWYPRLPATHKPQVMSSHSAVPKYIQVKDNHILLHVLVKAGSKRPGLLQTTQEEVVLHIHSQPKQGEANKELIDRQAVVSLSSNHLI